jgi:DNA-directed RNA polymerase subunit RPC12/RpoP
MPTLVIEDMEFRCSKCGKILSGSAEVFANLIHSSMALVCSGCFYKDSLLVTCNSVVVYPDEKRKSLLRGR